MYYKIVIIRLSRLFILCVCMCKPNKTFPVFAYSQRKASLCFTHCHVSLLCGVIEITTNMAVLGCSDCVNMICENQILAAQCLPSVLIAFLREKHLSQESSNKCFADCGHREAFVGKTSGA